MFGRLLVIVLLGAFAQARGQAYMASPAGQRLSRNVARLVFFNAAFLVLLSLVAMWWGWFWLHVGVAFIAVPMYLSQAWRPLLATTLADWGISGDTRVTEYIARAIASFLFLLGWWNMLAPEPALNFHAHPEVAVLFSLGVMLFILRKEFVSPSLKETRFFKWSAAMIAGPCFVLLVWWRVTPIIAAGHLAVVTAPAGTIMNDAVAAVRAAAAERTSAVGDFSETADWHAADRSWPRGRRVEIAVSAATRVDASVKLANDMPVRVVATGPAGSTVTVGLFDRGLGTTGGWAQVQPVTVGKPIDLWYLGLRTVEVWVDGDPRSATRVLFDRGVR